jgi:amidase
MYIARIDSLDRRGPMLRAVLEINPRALDIADALDRERATTGPRGPLHGVPVLIKDNVETADRMMTTAGSHALDGWYAPTDAPLVARLRAAGAVSPASVNGIVGLKPTVGLVSRSGIVYGQR